ncbi:hypothetical protein CEXT_677641 [Caerostris extrusa]|uniref:Uncharacterized protein n=1 Tax=Caerostris extrusa TaxID=172846 RepID=A0AAV4XCE3_CAEEX|nr:hypothetical protein CEXT_677641 [Caerostris extrusa]
MVKNSPFPNATQAKLKFTFNSPVTLINNTNFPPTEAAHRQAKFSNTKYISSANTSEFCSRGQLIFASKF